MRFLAVALIPHDTADVVAIVTQLMDPYNLEHKVAPYKEYVSSDGVARLAAAFRLPTATPEAVAERLVKRGEEAGVDEVGLYWTTTSNPWGQWDVWLLNSMDEDVKPTADFSENHQVSAVVTPDGEWHDFMCGWDWSEEEKAEFRRQACELVRGFPDCLAVLLDCHR